MRKILFVLAFLCLSFLFVGALDVGEVKGAPVTVTRWFSSLYYDGYVVGVGTNYTSTQQATTGTAIVDDINFTVGGQWGVYGVYYIYRSALYFDTSIIPTGATNVSATLSLYVYLNQSEVDFNVTIQNGQPSYPHAPLESGDYWKDHYSGNGGSRNTSTIEAENAYWNVTLNSYGIGWINKDGVTKFFLRSSNDINAIAPPGGFTYEYVQFRTYEYGEAYAPKLYVTYETGGYSYLVHGPYYEDGSVANVNVSLTLEIENSESESYTLNGAGGADTLNITVEQRGVAFTWNLTGSANITRAYYLTDAYFEEIWIYLPSTPYYLYTFSVTDLVGLTNAYLEVILNVDGQNRIVERQSLSIISSIPFWLTFNKHYEIRLISDEGTYSWGSFIPATTYDVSLTVRGVDFPKETLFICKYVRIYGLRRFGTPTGNITIYYQDLLNMTNSVSITLYYRNGSVVDTAEEATSYFSYTFLNVYNDTDYKVVCEINHQQFGIYAWGQYFSRRYSSNPWDCLAFLGTFPFDISMLFSILAIIFAGGCATVLNPEVGAFVACATATILCVMGWFPISAILLVGAWILTIIFALARAKQRVVIR